MTRKVKKYLRRYEEDAGDRVGSRKRWMQDGQDGVDGDEVSKLEEWRKESKGKEGAARRRLMTKKHLHLQSERREREATFHALRGSLELGGPGLLRGRREARGRHGAFSMCISSVHHHVAIHMYIFSGKYG